MSVEKVKFTSESIATSQKKLNDNFTALELEDAKKQEIMQYSTMPTAGSSYAGKVVQFIGTTGETYTKGYFYECKLVESEYAWVQTKTQPASTVTLNGTATDAASFYAPTDAGTSGNVLKSAGSGNAPTWGSLSASDVGALADSTKYGASLSVSGTSLQLKDQDGNNLGNAVTTQDTGATSVEVKSGDSGNVVTNMTYDASTRKITFEKGITALTQHQDISGKLDKKPDGTNDLIVNNKITNIYLPDFLLGQVLYGGTVTTGAVASLTPNAKSKLGTSDNSITLTNDTTAITGYAANEGIYYIASADFTFAGLSILTGDWLISKGTAWDKIDNTDAVTGVKGNAENSYRIGNISIDPDDLDDTNTTNKFVTSTDKSTWSGKQDAIDSSHKLSADLVDDTSTTNKFVTTADKSNWDGKQSAKSTYTFTASDAGWSSIDANGFYTLTITSTKKPFICFNSSGEQVLAGLKSDGTYIYVITDTKFAGSVEAF